MTQSPEFLNVDEVVPKINKVISIKGTRHKFEPPSVGDFLDEMQRIKVFQKRFEGKDRPDETEVVEFMVESMKDSIKGAFPTVTDEELKGLSYQQMEAIRNFIQANLEEDSEEAEDAQGN